MKPNSFRPCIRKSPADRGMALVLVLLFLILITALALAFYQRVSVQMSASKIYADGARTRILADSAVRAVIGQIRLATASTNSSGDRISWASQPGMIRSYDSTGAPEASYKLYSSDSMIVSGSPAAGFANDFDATWTAGSTINQALYTDLNEPVSDQFPIIDPRAAAMVSGTNSLVDGFSYSGTTSSVTIPNVTQPAGTSDAGARLPMPVKWIYQLKDGTLTVPTGGSDQTATWSGAGTGVPTDDNPIVARMAFWTDDETCKLNINTACGGTYWTTPRFNSGMDLAYSRYKPAANEFTRFPGHPATTSLLPVFWSYAGLTSPNTNLVPLPQISSSNVMWASSQSGPGSTDAAPSWQTSGAADIFQDLANFSPRNTFGGSKLGTVATTGWNVPAFTTATPDADRLYSSVDEALFAVPETPSPNADRSETEFGGASLNASDVQKLRFFLTAKSRAPEMNPFDLPKVSLWPQLQNVANRTTMDQVLALCSTLNGEPYFFTRGNSLSPTADWTSRNAELFNYLTTLWGEPIPGFGASLESRYTEDGDNRLLALMYDYLRSTVNILDTTGGTPAGSPTSFPSAFVAQTDPTILGYGQVTPINISADGETYKGLGRFPAIKQVAIMFIATAANQPPLQVVSSGPNMGRPLLFDVNGVSLLDAGGNLTNAGVDLVLSGDAFAHANPMHPVVGDPTTPIQQLLSSDGEPVLAVDAAKLGSNPNDASAIYPVFNPVNEYPTISSNGIVQIASSPPTEEFVTSGGTHHNYHVAVYSPAGGSPPPQTHAGLPFLTVPQINGATPGAYNVPNPRYQLANLPDPATVLTPGMTQIQALMIIDPVDPAAGQIALSPNIQVEISGLDDFQVDSKSLGFPGNAVQSNERIVSNVYELDPVIISMGMRMTAANGGGGTAAAAGLLSFISDPVIVGGAVPGTEGGTFSFKGGPITVKIWTPNSTMANLNSRAPASTANSHLVQTLNLTFPDAPTTSATTGFPTPLLPPLLPGKNNPYLSDDTVIVSPNAPQIVADLAPSSLLTFDAGSPLSTAPNSGVGDTIYASGVTHIGIPPNANRSSYYILPERTTDPKTDYHAKLTADTVRSVEVLYGDTRLSGALAETPQNFFAPHKFYFNTTMRSAHSLRGFRGATSNFLSGSYVGLSGWDYENQDGGHYQRGVPANSPTQEIANIEAPPTGASALPNIFPNVTSSTEFDDTIFNGANGASAWSGLTPFSDVWALGGDFSSSPGGDPDAPLIGKMNAGDFKDFPNILYLNPDYAPDQNNLSISGKNSDSFSPNRLVPSSVIFGSLPILVDTNTPGGVPAPIQSWRTLLFCPNPASYEAGKDNAAQTRTAIREVADAGSVPDTGTAPDFLFLDYFNMPVVAPYAISEPFSTAGKVNMNYQIAPFSYITRTTALRGVLRDSVVTAVQDEWVGMYKHNSTQPSSDYFTFLTDSGQWAFRYPINATETLKQFAQRFSNNDIFRSPSEICSLWLYPAEQPTASTSEAPETPLVEWDANNTNIKNWWYENLGTTAKSLTGDNVRESPYATIYPRLTTQSNTYTVHFRVQVLQKIPGTPVAQWVGGKDKVRSEFRGSSVIERYLDPGDSSIPDIAAATTSGNIPTLDKFYKFRVLSTRQFAP